MKVGILVFEGVDLLDVGGPYEVFLTASRLAVRRGDEAPFAVDVVGTGPVTAYGGLGLIPTTEGGSFDVVVVPGAIAIDDAVADEELMEQVRRLTAEASLAASVCTGAFLLAEAGLLADRPWTTHPEDVALLAERTGSARGRDDARWVDAGEVVTAGGLSAGIAMALHLVDRFADRDLAIATARQLDYVWNPGAD